MTSRPIRGPHKNLFPVDHTCPNKLVNAGCRITSLQKLLGHQRLNATMVYARVHDRTVAEDYYAAMAVIEKQLYQQTGEMAVTVEDSQNENGSTCYRLLMLVEVLNAEATDERHSALVEEMRREILALAKGSRDSR